MTDADPAPADAVAGDAPLDRTISPIAGRFATGRKGKALVLAGLAAGCGAFALASSHPGPRKAAAPPEPPPRQVVAFEPAAPPTLDRPGAGAPSLTGGALAQGPGRATPADPVPQSPNPATPRAADPLAAIRAAPLLAYGGGAQAAAPPLSEGAALLRPSFTAADLGGPRQASAIGTSRAHRLGDRSFLILAGASIPCVLQTALDTATAGHVACVIPQDVYSDNGATVLMEKGTRVVGEYRGGLKQGQDRLFVLWTRAVTPGGVALDLASPAADALGRAGFDGDLDRHFWDRFGGALLLSVVDGGTSALAANTAPPGSVRLPSDAAATVLGHTADLPPTLRKAQGSEVSILAAQDFDFSGVYALKAR
jgi:type IV secretion system protein VirB10